MAQTQHQQQLRNLKDLLSEDQEPFHLPNYIADKRSNNLSVIKHKQQLKQHPSLSPLHLQQLQKQSRQNASFPSKLCAKTACFLSSSFPTDSPAEGYFTRSKSPILLSPHKGTVKSSSPSNSMFLHVPAKTAALLLEAALRIQRSNNNSHNLAESKSAAKLKSSTGFGLLGSVIRRITRRNRSRKLVTNNPPADEIEVDVVRWADSVIHGDDNDRIRRGKSNGTCGGNESTSLVLTLEEERFDIAENGRWSDEKKLIDLGSSTSTSSLSSSSTTTTTTTSTSTTSCSNSCCSSHSRDESDEEEDVGISGSSVVLNSGLDRVKSERINEYGEAEEDEDFSFCLSPFRVGINKIPSPDCYDPVSEFSSPARSPSRFDYEEHTTISVQDSFSSTVVEDLGQEGNSREEEEEDKEQNSPVSVLQFDHEEYCHGNDDQDCQQRSNQPPPHKLTRKFNNLSDNLKPIELDFDNNSNDDSTTIEGFSQKPGIKRLISDLIFEEYERAAAAASQCGSDDDDSSLVVKRVCKRLESWDEIKPDTINMMVELDLKREGTDRNSEWSRRRVCKEEDRLCVAKDVEVLIFSVLVDQFICELVL